MILRKIPTLLLVLLLLSSVRSLIAQTLTSATVVGVVKDSSGAVVPGVTVRIRQPQTDAISTTVSGSAGEYRFPFLKPGDYEVSAEAAGQKAAPIVIHLLVGQEQAVDLALSVQAVQQTVQVEGSNELLQTENGNNLNDYNLHYVENTPVNGGDITNVAFTTPGVRVNVGGGNTNFNVNGLPFSSVLFTYNGADIVEPYNLNNKSGSSNNTLGQNDVAEASVITNAFSAQYGRMAGAQVNYISKSGTNQFHGNLVENYNGDVLNANDYFSNASNTPRGRSVANQYAGSIGGPIKRDKVTFFFNYEGLRYALPTNKVVSLPSTALQNYVLANVPAASLPYYQDLFKLYNAAPGISRAVPVTNGTGQLQDGTGNLGCGKNNGLTGVAVPGSTATFGGANGVSCAVAFVSTASSVNTEYLADGRVDWNINTKQKLYFRISRDYGVQASSTSPISPLFNGYSPQPWIIPQLNHTYAITPSLVNNFVLNGNYYTAVFYGSSNFQQAQQALPLSFSFTDGGAGDAGFQALGPAAPEGRLGQQLGIIDDLSWNHGKHTLQFGVNNRNNRITSTANQTGSIIGTYTFGSVGDFSQGNIADTHNYNTFTQAFPLLPTVHLRVDSLGFYGQDEWAIRQNLKLTYGARFEYQGNPWCKEGCYSRANTEFLASGYDAGATVPYNATLLTGIHKDFIQFEGIIPEPRVAIAYSPFGSGKTVIRGGLGLFTNTIAASIAASVYGNAPNKFSPVVTNGIVGLTNDAGSSQAAATASNAAFQAGFNNGDTLKQLQAAVPSGVTFSTPTLYVNPNHFHTIKALEWSAEIEQPLSSRDVFTISYAGNHGYNEPLSNTAANGWAADGFGGLPTAIPDPRFSTVTQIFDEGYSRYDGVSFVERHAVSHSVQGQVSYTWSKALQLGTIYNPTVYALNGATPTGTANQNYGPAAFDTRNNFMADFVYSTPRLQNHLLNRAVSDWKLGGKVYLYSGRPFTVTNSGISTANVFSSSFSGTVLANTTNPSVIGIHCGKSAVKTPCLNTGEFSPAVATATIPAQSNWGNTKPNSFYGPGFASYSAQLGKEIHVNEVARFELGADAYNLFNHPNFGIPNADVNKGQTLGTVTTDVSVPTSIYGTGQGAIVSGRVVVVYGKFFF
ncbi:carboxypeptidase regulatory-like domain-containing protein [Silvibacterium sp.]|uniref:TonB-dependent receptor n=1 Tax=Silvibacterium sp. TaxID=1964179 RepID=UPI0039E6408D